jgi:hypothetical protein
MNERIKMVFQRAEVQQQNIPAGDYFADKAQKFLQDHEGEDSDEMLSQDLARLLALAWNAGMIFQSESRQSSCME